MTAGARTTLDLRPALDRPGPLAELTPNPLALGLEGSAILAIAAHVRSLSAAGADVSNFTIGDFDSAMFPIPDVFRERLKAELDAGQTHYPPADGIPELRGAIRSFYSRRLGLDYPDGSVQVGSGARPPIFAAFQTIVAPGDQVVYPVPTWNVRYYVYFNRAEGIPVVTRPENGFMPTADDLLPHLGTARMLVLNSPLNPCGTVIAPALLREICNAIVAENRRRERVGSRPLMLLYDQVYWQLTFDGHAHHTPVSLVPEMAPYTLFIDAISKCWAATGLRVGWAVVPPWVRARMRPLVGHMGAWAGRAEQRATAALLREPELVAPFMGEFRAALRDRLHRLRDGLHALKSEGLPVDCLDAQGAIYLSARFDLGGLAADGEDRDEASRRFLLEHAGVAVVPFTAFGFPQNTGWVRFSVGSVSNAQIDTAIQRLREALRKR